MSSTTKPGQTDQVLRTPSWATKRFIERIDLGCDKRFPTNGVWLEPCAGEGDIIRAVDEVRSPSKWWAAELRHETRLPGILAASLATGPCAYASWTGTDFFTLSIPVGSVQVCITNPPFALGMQFLHRLIELEIPTIALLLPMRFCQGPDERVQFFTSYPPDLFVLPDRPSFSSGPDGRPDGGTDSDTYAWMVWHNVHLDVRADRECMTRRIRRGGDWELLAKTPAAERSKNRAVW